MKPRWRVTAYSLNYALGTRTLYETREYRHRFSALVSCALINASPAFAGIKMVADMAPIPTAPPNLTAIPVGKADVPKLQVGRTL